uniref:Protein kinase domain-containing protein n=1 Tax=Chromera velia CCMP2878 TaxID=1169474 RepID=A0A0G4F5P3_9ALVE|eukprot:Cvel_15245.t1-p1 / transcript=Cvel_15245.t1 / gene=Cvel_15245 / organism=Chromera_velia_CCMP2878 / gene_product=Cyclin-dependent kinase 1, putative / transcript_product=Cyclin-dependent kinase 1, putative / location=Cvel_scaffold1116:33609-41005(-) / protein_length=274 / sequence_SO=supercontig / SO=protein_coding / is_pseudo=false
MYRIAGLTMQGADRCFARVAGPVWKPNNVVLDKQGFVRLIDFGMARSFQVKKAEAPTGGIQNERYRAPEVFEGGKCEGQPLDSWAFGCVLAEMCLGESPMPEGGVQAVREWVRRKENKKEEIKNMLTRKRADLMASSEGVEALEEIAFLPEGLLQEKPEDRLSLEACIQHKFFRVRDLQKLNLTFPDETPGGSNCIVQSEYILQRLVLLQESEVQLCRVSDCEELVLDTGLERPVILGLFLQEPLQKKRNLFKCLHPLCCCIPSDQLALSSAPF